MAERRRVTSTVYPTLSVRLDIRGRQSEVSALLDTGFTGEVAFPLDILGQAVGLPDEHTDWELADGSIVDAPTYLETLEIIGFSALLPVEITGLGNEYILGRGVLDLFVVTFDRGERVIVEM